MELLPTPLIGQGTWQMERDDESSCIAALRRGLDLGLTHIDTAEMYGSGEVERIVGKAITGRRDQVFLASKVLPTNASRKGTIAACETSLRQLGTDRLDLYMLHWPGQHPLEETFSAFETLKQMGKIVRWGVSNFDTAELKRAVAIAGPGKILCNQVLYHLKERAIEHTLISYCQAQSIPVVAYSPFGSGSFPDGNTTLQQVATKYGKTPRQVALAFLARHDGTYAIPKASQLAHVEDNAGAQGLQLSEEDVGAIDKAFPRGSRHSLGYI